MQLPPLSTRFGLTVMSTKMQNERSPMSTKMQNERSPMSTKMQNERSPKVKPTPDHLTQSVLCYAVMVNHTLSQRNNSNFK
jgi:hypothetical protein